MRALLLPPALALLLAGCLPTPAGTAPVPLPGMREPLPATFHQGGVVFLQPPAGGFAIGGRLVPAGLVAQGAQVTLVLADGAAVAARLAADGGFKVEHLPTGSRLGALHVEVAGKRHWLDHDTGGGARHRWVDHARAAAFDLGAVTLDGEAARATANPLVHHDTDADGQPDHLDLDDDADGQHDHLDPDDDGRGPADLAEAAGML